MESITIKHGGADYHIYRTDDGGWDVHDCAGSRPAELRAQGPWDTPEEAESAIRATMTGETLPGAYNAE